MPIHEGGVMPIAVVQEWAEGGSDTTNYDALHARIMDGPMPDGFIVHTAGATADGGFRIFEVWESEAQYSRFVEERLMPLVNEIGGDAPPPATSTYELHEFVVAR
jgi:hypothetical protein